MPQIRQLPAVLPTSLVGSYPQPDWLINREKLAGRFPPRVRAKELWRVDPEYLAQAQDDATLLAIRAQEQAGLDILTDGSPHPDVAILDLVMPVLDGNRLYQAMKADPALSQIPVIVSTSSPSRAPQGVLILAKPVNLDRLLEAVADIWRDRPHSPGGS